MSKSTNGCRFVIYCRVSTVGQAETGESLPAQEADLRKAVIEQLGGIVAKVYRQQEHATTGNDRRSLAYLLNDVKAGTIDCVIVRDSSRLSRDPKDSEEVRVTLASAGVRLFYGVNEQDISTAQGALFSRVKSAMDSFYVEGMKAAAASSRWARAQNGWPHSGSLPFARCVLNAKTANRARDKPVWALIPEKAELVRRMFRMYVEQGAALGATGRAVGMNPETVRRVLLNQSGPTWTCALLNPETGAREDVTTSVPRLLEDFEIEQVRDRATENRLERAGWVTRRRGYPLAKYIRCANPACNWSNLSGHRSTSRGLEFSYYVHLKRKVRPTGCFSSLPASAIEAAVLSKLGTLIYDSEALRDSIHAALGERSAGRQDLLDELESTRHHLRTCIRDADVLLDLVVRPDSNLVGDLARDRVTALNQRAEELRSRETQLSKELALNASDAELTALCDRVLYQFQALDGRAPIV